jgi:hypothetical protein
MTGTRKRCRHCHATKSITEFRQGRRLYSGCHSCRAADREYKQTGVYVRVIPPPPDASVVRVTMLDYPRKCRRNSTPLTQRREYDTLHAECLKRHWMIGADLRVNWCIVHRHAARSWCDDCLDEATAWQSEQKVARQIEALAL